MLADGRIVVTLQPIIQSRRHGAALSRPTRHAPEEPCHLVPGTIIVVMTRLRTVSRPNPKEIGEISHNRQRNKDLRCKRPSDPKTKVVEPVVGGEPVAFRRAEEGRSEEPGS